MEKWTKALQRALYGVNGLFGIVDGAKGSAVHGVCVVLGDYELALFDPLQQPQWAIFALLANCVTAIFGGCHLDLSRTLLPY
jgi:hypothetical protein